jgi:hypothetical protein
MVRAYMDAGHDLGVINLWRLATLMDTNRCHVLADFHHPNNRWHSNLAMAAADQILATLLSVIADGEAPAVAPRPRAVSEGVDLHAITSGHGSCPARVMVPELRPNLTAVSFLASPPRSARAGLELSHGTVDAAGTTARFGKAAANRLDRQEGVRVPCCHIANASLALANAADGGGGRTVVSLTWHLLYEAHNGAGWSSDTQLLQAKLLGDHGRPGMAKGAEQTQGGDLALVRHFVKRGDRWERLRDTSVPYHCFLGLDGVGMSCKFFGACSEWWLPPADAPLAASDLHWLICQDCNGADPESTTVIRTYLSWAAALLA